jgi:hypothetical protein
MAGNTLKRNLRSVESAAIAGVLYSLMTIASLFLMRSFPLARGSTETITDWISDEQNRRNLIIGMNLAAVSSVAFLWFVAVIRRRIGDREDKFFSTVFLGAAILYIAIWLVAAAAVSSLAVAYDRFAGATVDSNSATFLVGFAEALILIVAPRLQGVFIMSTSTLILRTAVLPRWLAYLGYGIGATMVLLPMIYEPAGIVFPVWVLVVSVTILFSKAAHADATERS